MVSTATKSVDSQYYINHKNNWWLIWYLSQAKGSAVNTISTIRIRVDGQYGINYMQKGWQLILHQPPTLLTVDMMSTAVPFAYSRYPIDHSWDTKKLWRYTTKSMEEGNETWFLEYFLNFLVLLRQASQTPSHELYICLLISVLRLSTLYVVIKLCVTLLMVLSSCLQTIWWTYGGPVGPWWDWGCLKGDQADIVGF